MNSFSKYAGFTGVRLGWTVVPKALKYADGSAVHQDFNRIMTTAFNGASNIVQQGGLAILDDAGLMEIDTLIDYYLANAAKLRQTMEGLGYKVGRLVPWWPPAVGWGAVGWAAVVALWWAVYSAPASALHSLLAPVLT